MTTAVAGSTYAQILNNTVHWIFTISDLPEWNDTQITVVDITSITPQPQAGWAASEDSNNNWTFTAPPAPPALTIAQAQAIQTQIINQAAQTALSVIVAAYPDLEIATWPQQYAEAQAYTANNTASTPLLSAIATASSDTVANLAANVMTLAANYQAASGAVIGKRIALTAQIMAVTTSVADVQAITW